MNLSDYETDIKVVCDGRRRERLGTTVKRTENNKHKWLIWYSALTGYWVCLPPLLVRVGTQGWMAESLHSTWQRARIWSRTTPGVNGV